MRSHKDPIWKIGLLSNKAMLIWAAAALAFLVLVTNIPFAQTPLKLTGLGTTGWLMAIITPLITVLGFEVKKLLEPRITLWRTA